MRADFQTKVSAHTPQSRIETARNLAKMKNKEQEPPKKRSVTEPSKPDANGRIMQRNEGKWSWKFIDHIDTLCLSVDVSKFMVISLSQIQGY